MRSFRCAKWGERLNPTLPDFINQQLHHFGDVRPNSVGRFRVNGGQWNIIAHPKYLRGVRDVRRLHRFRADGRGVSTMWLLARDFGKRFMFDPPSAALLGPWKWFNGTTVTFHGDGRFTTPTRKVYGTWRKTGNSVTMRWSTGFTDYLRLSGKRLSGKGYPGGHSVSGYRL